MLKQQRLQQQRIFLSLMVKVAGCFPALLMCMCMAASVLILWMPAEKALIQ